MACGIPGWTGEQLRAEGLWHGPRLRRPWGGVKAHRRMWDGERDHWLSPLSIKPSQGLIDVQDEMM